MKATILGSGTSSGVPTIAGNWGACDPADPKNRRRRVSLLIETVETRLVVDTSVDFREQALGVGLKDLTAVLYTHEHADHTHGIDDLRGLAAWSGRQIPVYGDARTLGTLGRRFRYIFEGAGDYPAICTPHVIEGPWRIGDIDIVPFLQVHGAITSLGFRFGRIAYSTDVNELTDDAFRVLDGVEVWIVDALRYAPHPTHAHLEHTLGWIAQVKPERAILTHLATDMDYASLAALLPAGIEPAYDGLVINLT